MLVLSEKRCSQAQTRSLYNHRRARIIFLLLWNLFFELQIIYFSHIRFLLILKFEFHSSHISSFNCEFHNVFIVVNIVIKMPRKPVLPTYTYKTFIQNGRFFRFMPTWFSEITRVSDGAHIVYIWHFLWFSTIVTFETQ